MAMAIHEAKQKVAQIAMGDLLGMSEPPEGVPDNYPFNACAWRDWFPARWYDELENVIRFVYRNERIPD